MPQSGLGKGQKLMGEEIKFIAIRLTAPAELEAVSFLWRADNASPAAPWSLGSVVSQEQSCLSTVSTPLQQPTCPSLLPGRSAAWENLMQNQTLNG